MLLHIDEGGLRHRAAPAPWFGYQNYGVPEPDFVTMAKGGGLGLRRDRLCGDDGRGLLDVLKQEPDDPMDYFPRHLDLRRLHGGPGGGRLRTWRSSRRRGLLANTLAMGARLMGNLEALKEKHAVVGDVRGKGLFAGAELVADRTRRRSLRPRRWVAGGGRRLHDARRHHRCDENRSIPGFNNTLCLSPALIATADRYRRDHGMPSTARSRGVFLPDPDLRGPEARRIAVAGCRRRRHGLSRPVNK